MPKTPTSQELFRARKQREEEEQVAYLPPGLYNHGNTCFMNSVLQGLIATHLLSDLAHFRSIPHYTQRLSNPLASWKSPLLTNGHEQGGSLEQPWINSMPIGDVLLDLLLTAWKSQMERGRETMSPKQLLAVLGRKYDQYLDFAQQDAHEFLRILLDATRMEELDVIKQRQPLPKTIKRRRNTITPQQHPNAQIRDEDKLMSLADMVFGGKLTSILVCQKCKKISQTCEDFNDISLSLKAEDYRLRKRDRFRNFAKKLTNLSALSLGTEMPRSTSMPSRSSQEAQTLEGDGEPLTIADPPRKSMDVIPPDTPQISTPQTFTSQESQEQTTPTFEDTSASSLTSGSTSDVGKTLLNGEKKVKNKKDKDSWVKLGRRISLTVQSLGKTPKESKEQRNRLRDSSSLEAPRRTSVQSSGYNSGTSEDTPSSGSGQQQMLHSVSEHSPPMTPAITLSRPPSPPVIINGYDIPDYVPSSTLVPSRPSSPLLNYSQPQRSKSPKPPKPSRKTVEYLRAILADTTPNSNIHFPLFNQSNESVWLSMNRFTGVEECLRMFTAVEVLDGENMVGCRRCWKIANGVYNAEAAQDDEEDDDEDDDVMDARGPEVQPELLLNLEPRRPERASPPLPLVSSSPSPHRPPPLPHLNVPLARIPTSVSSPTVAFYAHPNNSDDQRSVSSLPEVSQNEQSETDAVPSRPSVTIIPYESPAVPASVPATPLEPHRRSTITGPQSIIPITRSTSLPVPPENPSVSMTGAAPRLGQVVSHLPPRLPPATLAVPKTRRNQLVADETDESSAESETSVDSSVSDAANQATPRAASHRPPRAKKPKPVIMQPAYKRYLIGTPPPVLVIHLKRFQQISKTPLLSFSHGFKKLDDYVSFPEFLDLAPYLAPKKEDFGLGEERSGQGKVKKGEKEKCMYRLYAVVVHIGNMLGGHYIAYTALPDPQHPDGQPDVPSDEKREGPRPPRQWAYISDTVVRLTTLEEVLKAKAYLCMYERI